jgi:hypothetical protein
VAENVIIQVGKTTPESAYSGMVRIPIVIAAGVIAAAGVATGDLLDATTHISLGSALSVGGVVMGAVWWFGRKFQQIEDRDRIVQNVLQTKKDFDDLRFDALQQRLSTLDCQRRDCPGEEKKVAIQHRSDAG